MTAAHEKPEFGETGRAFYDFFWSQFADWYIESAKSRLYSSDPQAAQTARAVRLSILGLVVLGRFMATKTAPLGA